jgi:RimJ/RimL family protein N-acetyltransferase
MMKKYPPLSTEHAKEFYENATLFNNPRIRRIPRFDYQNLPDTERLSYELLTWDNFKNFLPLFENDPHPFVMDDFKTLDKLEMYAVSQLEYNWYSFKRGACDWFLRLKTTGELVGVLHLYDLNWEFMNGKHPHCCVGYAIAEPYRRQGFAMEATAHLLEQIPLLFRRYIVRAVPEGDNTVSRSLLEKLGFELLEDEGRRYTSVLYEKQLVADIPIKTFDAFLEEEEKYR